MVYVVATSLVQKKRAKPLNNDTHTHTVITESAGILLKAFAKW